MKNMRSDELFEIFKRRLDDIDPDNQTSEQLVSETVTEYLEVLNSRGHIPIQFVEDIQQDLSNEVLMMLRKKTYGHLNLKTYKETKKLKAKSRNT